MKTKVNIVKDELYAFWAYSSFPYLLGGQIIRMNENGSIEPKGYTGFYFRPVCIVPLETGLKLHEQLKILEKEHKKAIDETNKKFKDRLMNEFSMITKHMKEKK
jgi:hypothetical protein